MQNVLVSYPGTISLKDQNKNKNIYTWGKEEGGRGKGEGWKAEEEVVEVGEEEDIEEGEAEEEREEEEG